MKFLSRIKAIEKKLVPEDTGPPFPIFIYEDGVLDRGDGSEKEIMSREDVLKLTTGRRKPFLLEINHPVIA